MRILFIRHGDPDYPNDTLTRLGHSQAGRLARSLVKVKIHRLYASPMGRAQLTAGYTARAKQMSVKVLPWLHELNGNYGGDKWAWNHPGARAFNKPGRLSLENWTGHVPYARHMLPVARRLHRAFDAFMSDAGCKRVQQRYKVVKPARIGKTMAFFCHAGTTLTLLAHLLHIPLPVAYSQFACDTTSVTELQLETMHGYGVFRLLRLNDIAHLK